MKELSIQSQAVVDRYNLHFDRCEQIEDRYGELKAMDFHQRHKAAPGSVAARKAFELLIGPVN